MDQVCSDRCLRLAINRFEDKPNSTRHRSSATTIIAHLDRNYAQGFGGMIDSSSAVMNEVQVVEIVEFRTSLIAAPVHRI